MKLWTIWFVILNDLYSTYERHLVVTKFQWTRRTDQWERRISARIRSSPNSSHPISVEHQHAPNSATWRQSPGCHAAEIIGAWPNPPRFHDNRLACVQIVRKVERGCTEPATIVDVAEERRAKRCDVIQGEKRGKVWQDVQNVEKLMWFYFSETKISWLFCFFVWI